MRSKKAIYNIITTLFLQVITVLYGFIVPKIIISNFGSNTNGLISSITQFLAYITLLESGFGPVVKSILYKPIADKDNQTVAKILKSSEKFFRTIAYIFLIYIIILCIIYPFLVSNNFEYLYTISLILIIALSTFAEYFFGMTYKLFLQADQKTYIISLIQIVTYILSIVSIVLLTKFNASIQLIKLVGGIIFVLRPIIQNYYVKKKYNINFNEVKEAYEIRQKWDGLAQHIAAVIHGNTDVTLLTIFCTISEVSVYSVYYMVVKGIKSIIQAFSNGIDASFGDMIAKNEQDNINKKFDMYEIMYFTIATILYTSTIMLITPFIKVYTKGINDVNYIRYTFGYLLVISEYIWAIRLPYSSIILAVGHFKETRKGAWIECLSNIIVSMLLVWKYGIIGVTIGTIIAMTIRTVEFMYHTNKYILKRNIFKSVKKIILLIIETVLIVFICKYLPYFDNISYINWVINAIMTGVVAASLVFVINLIIYKKDMKLFTEVFIRVLKCRNKGAK